MTIAAKGDNPGNGRNLLITAEDKGCDVQVEVESGSAEGGLLLFYNEKNFSGLTRQTDLSLP